MQPTLIAVLLLLTPFVCEGSSAGGAPPTAQAGLEHGSTSQRLDVLLRIARTPPGQRDDATWAAIEREARRMLALYQRHVRPSEDEENTRATYSMGLVQLLGAATRPSADFALHRIQQPD